MSRRNKYRSFLLRLFGCYGPYHDNAKQIVQLGHGLVRDLHEANKYRFFICLFSVLLGTIFSFDAYGQSNYPLGGLPGAATRMGFGAQGIGIANALTAVKSGDAIGYYNPALTPFQTSPVGTASFGFLPFDRHLNFLNYTQSLKPTAGISIGIINAGVSNIEGRNRDGGVTDTYSTSENVFLFSFGVKLNEQAAIGLTTKVFYYSLFEGVKSTTTGFDIGFVYSLDDEWTVGAVIQDINSKYKWDTSSLYGREGNSTTERFPLRRKLAVSYAPKFFQSRISGELEFISSVMLARIGAEIPIYEGITVRGGVDQISFAGDVTSKPSLGFSFQTPLSTWKPTLHYTYVIEPYSTGGIHLFSLSLNFE
ncbi:MAG: hypothetical protein HY276_12790 [Ignavibacteriales bacterium]|nr:hypothetical protein [Ignavibacteriales bacterium]